MSKRISFRVAIGLLHCCFALLTWLALSPFLVHAQVPTPPPATSAQRPTSAQVDSLARRVDYQAVRIDAMKEATDRTYFVFAVLGALGSFIGGFFVFQQVRQQKYYLEERGYYEQRAKSYERRENENHMLMLNLAWRNEARHETSHNEITKNVETLNQVLSAFQKIMDFKVVEAREAAKLVERMQEELKELEETRAEQVDMLLQTARRLVRKRFVYANPDADFLKLTTDFRTQMDTIPQKVLMKYTGADKTGAKEWRYGEIFLRRGIIAYYDNDPAKARDMLKIAESLFPFTEDQLQSMTDEQRFGTAFTRYYLALLEKNYGDIRLAQNYIESSYLAWGKNIDNELVTPTTRAEILSYAPGGSNRARDAIAEILQRVVNLKKTGRTLAKQDAICAVRVHLFLGNTRYLEEAWDQALQHFQDALKEDEGKLYSYFACHSISQALRKLDQKNEAESMLEQTYQHLLESRHLETKVALDSRILLNALAYLCTRAKQPKEADRYRQTILNLWTKIEKVDGLELRLFSLEQKKQVSKKEFWEELFEG